MDNGKIAILGHFPAPNFDRNSTPIVALYQSSHARGLAFAKLLNVLLGHVFFCRDVGLADMNPEELLSRVAKQFTRLGIHQSKIACLLYTSDAADERSSVDLGGRRIIK